MLQAVHISKFDQKQTPASFYSLIITIGSPVSVLDRITPYIIVLIGHCASSRPAEMSLSKVQHSKRTCFLMDYRQICMNPCYHSGDIERDGVFVTGSKIGIKTFHFHYTFTKSWSI